MLNEENALQSSTKWVNGKDNLYGYFGYRAANYLVGTGKYQFYSSCFWGYILKKVGE